MSRLLRLVNERDDALLPIVSFGIVARRGTEAAMSVEAAERVKHMTDAELKIAQQAAEVLCRLAGLELAQRRRG